MSRGVKINITKSYERKELSAALRILQLNIGGRDLLPLVWYFYLFRERPSRYQGKTTLVGHQRGNEGEESQRYQGANDRSSKRNMIVGRGRLRERSCSGLRQQGVTEDYYVFG